jgi:hypothetical protein
MEKPKERNELLPKFCSASVELTSIADVYACEADVAGWPRPSQEWPHLLVLNAV